MVILDGYSYGRQEIIGYFRNEDLEILGHIKVGGNDDYEVYFYFKPLDIWVSTFVELMGEAFNIMEASERLNEYLRLREDPEDKFSFYCVPDFSNRVKPHD
jgi:hypothetical protein